MSDFADAVGALLARCLPDFKALDDCRRLTGGANQETYAVDVVCRGGPRRLALRRAAGGALETTHGQPGLAVEAKLMDAARAAGVPEPEVIAVLTPADGLGEGFLMHWVDGETLGARIARHDDFAAVRPRLARQCGEILARIHAIDVDAAGLRGELEELEPRAFVERTWANYRAFDTPQPMIDYTARWLLDNAPTDQRLTLVHNDFRNGNLMVDPEHGVVAVLDWEVAHIGDPMRDLGWICTHSWRFGVDELEVGGFGRLEDLIAGYESVSGNTVAREQIHYWQVFGSFWWAVGCLIMAQHYRDGPDSTVERPGIGRRSSECQIDCVNLLIPGPVTLPEADGAHEQNMPRTDELLTSVSDFLRGEVSTALGGRERYLARVAANSLDIVGRELALGGAGCAAEALRLRALLGQAGTLDDLRWLLVTRLRDGTIALDNNTLQTHLRETVAARLAIDQPRYPGLATALKSR